MSNVIDDVYTILHRGATAFDGASTKYKEDMNNVFFGSPDQIISRELLLLQQRSLHAIRNNGYAKIARDKYVTNVGSLKVLWHDNKNRRHNRMQDLWDAFADNPSLDGYGTLCNLQSLWHSSLFSTGNAFTRKLIRKGRKNSIVPLVLEPIQSELHDLFYFGDGRKTVRHGIGFTDNVPDTYYFRLQAYQEFPIINNTQNITAIPSNEVLHLFNRELPGQWLGVPVLSSILIPLYELDELMDATVARQKASQAISWIITNSNPTNMMPVGVPIIDKAANSKEKVVFKATGSNVQYLNKGENITFHQGADIGPNFVKLAELELRRISNACHVPYHQLTGDTNGIDFSTLRALLIELRSRIEYTHHFLTIPLGLAPLTAYFKELAQLYYPNVKNATPSYQLPRFYGVDDLKDAQADVLEIQNGLATLDSKLQERHTTFEAIAADRERLKELGLDNLLFPNGAGKPEGNGAGRSGSNGSGVTTPPIKGVTSATSGENDV
jgi:lambda family phage portal protein